jgi:tRNA threonylcarbamoyladenosine biosynthesis protein TsaB
MRVLAAHTTTPTLSVAFTEGGRVLGERTLPPGREHLENLAPMIRELAARLRISLEALDGFGVAIGPGSFSGIRIGLAAMKGMALALEKPVVGISSLAVLATQGLSDGDAGASVIDARRGEMYVAAYKKLENRLIELCSPELIPLAQLGRYCEALPKGLILCGGAIVDGLEAEIPNVARTVLATPSAAVCAMMAAQRLGSGDVDELHALSPLYIRRSDAEEKRAVEGKAAS